MFKQRKKRDKTAAAISCCLVGIHFLDFPLPLLRGAQKAGWNHRRLMLFFFSSRNIWNEYETFQLCDDPFERSRSAREQVQFVMGKLQTPRSRVSWAAVAGTSVVTRRSYGISRSLILHLLHHKSGFNGDPVGKSFISATGSITEAGVVPAPQQHQFRGFPDSVSLSACPVTLVVSCPWVLPVVFFFFSPAV